MEKLNFKSHRLIWKLQTYREKHLSLCSPARTRAESQLSSTIQKKTGRHVLKKTPYIYVLVLLYTAVAIYTVSWLCLLFKWILVISRNTFLAHSSKCSIIPSFNMLFREKGRGLSPLHIWTVSSLLWCSGLLCPPPAVAIYNINLFSCVGMSMSAANFTVFQRLLWVHF